MTTRSEGTSTRIDRYVPALTGLRAVAAYLVFLHHYNPVAKTPNEWAHRLMAQGYVGVTLFFVLSGFLIYHRYAELYFSHASWSWRTYYQNRFARIAPLYVLLLLLTIGINSARGQPMSWLELGLNLTLAKGFFEHYKFSGIAQSWSLTVEECFYLVAPLLFVALRRWGAWLLTAFLLSIGFILWAAIGSMNWSGFFGSLPFVLFYTFFGRAFEFVAGMWLASRWHQHKLPRIRYATINGLLLIGICVGWQVSLLAQVTNSNMLLTSELITYNFILPLGIGLLLLGLLQEKSNVQRFLASHTAQESGRSSYAFYLIHIGVISKLVQHQMVGSNLPMLFIVLVITAYGLYSWVEKPLQRWLRAE